MKKNILFSLAVFFITSVYTFAQPLSPILVEPPKDVDVALMPVQLDWQPVSGATGYLVEYTTDPNGTKISANTNATTTDFTIPAADLTENTTYYWRVYGSDGGGLGDPSEWFTFTTACEDALGSVGNMTDGVIDLIADNAISPGQGSILISRLHSVETRLNNNQNFYAIIQMVLFEARVWILKLSNLISQDTYNSLIYSANGVIDLIADDNNSPINTEDLTTPKVYTLGQNYPNPFNPATTIEYSIPQNAQVSLRIYDMLGRQVAELVNKDQETGTYIVNWDASGLSSGVYFYTINAGSFTETKKMILSK